MRIGSYVPPAATPKEWAVFHAQRGLGAAYWPLPVDAPTEAENAFVAAAREADLVIAEVGVWNNLLEEDATLREANIRYAIERLAQAERVGARCCVNISGSRSTQWDGPDPRNLSEETWERVVKSTQRILDAVRPTRTAYTLEPMPWMIPYDIDSMRRLLAAVNRPGFGVHVDMVNLLSSFEKLMDNGAYTRAFFGQFGPHIRSVHAKDAILGHTLTLHIDEAIPGEGVFDFEALLGECAKLDDIPVMAEHLQSDAEYAKACAFLQNKAKSMRLTLSCAHG